MVPPTDGGELSTLQDEDARDGPTGCRWPLLQRFGTRTGSAAAVRRARRASGVGMIRYSRNDGRPRKHLPSWH